MTKIKQPRIEGTVRDIEIEVKREIYDEVRGYPPEIHRRHVVGGSIDCWLVAEVPGLGLIHIHLGTPLSMVASAKHPGMRAVELKHELLVGIIGKVSGQMPPLQAPGIQPPTAAPLGIEG